MPSHFNNNRSGGGRQWGGGGSRGKNRFHQHGAKDDRRGGHGNRSAGLSPSFGHITCTQGLISVLGGDRFPLCSSVSLRLDKYVKIGDKTKLGEITDAVKLHNSSRPSRDTFIPRPGFDAFVATLQSNLIINQAGGVLENAGISLDRHFNVPYLPGSALKGVARHAAWCEWKAKTDESERKELAGRIAATFGFPTMSDELDAMLEKSGVIKQSGAVTFMPAYPCGENGASASAALAVDILTPHGGNDWTDPVPNPFPVVAKGSSFKFAVGPAKVDGEKYIKDAVRWLKKGLMEYGLGGKTAAGYGVFKVQSESLPDPARRYTIRLVSPAFLRGAEGDEGILREASLRGVLRYWWRILFRSVLAEDDIKRLETMVWGGSGESPTASQIVVRLHSLKEINPVLYNKESFAKRLPSMFQKPRFDRRQGRTVTTAPGLAYASYGMDDSGRRRKVIPPGAEWVLDVTFRPRDGTLSDTLAVHAELALKALCTYGGIGSRSRKGFGSLDCGMNLDITDPALWTLMADAVAPFGFAIDPEKAGEYSFLSGDLPDPISVPLGTHDAWAAVDRIGFALQTTATSYKHRKEKGAAGLPRKIHGPLKDRKLPHQHHWTPPENLSPEGGTLLRAARFASPLFIHIAPGESGMLKVNAIAFPSALIRPLDVSCEVLHAYLDDLKMTLEETGWK